MIDEDRLLRIPEVLEKCAIGKNSLEERIAAGSFPRPVWIGPKSRRWKLSEIQAWIKSRPTETPTT